MNKRMRTLVSAINGAYYAADRVLNSGQVGMDLELTAERDRRRLSLGRKFKELYDECERQEREHRAFGRRLQQSMRGRASVETCARYFAVVAIIREVPEVRSWWTACDIRRDWALGYAIGEAVADLGLWPAMIRLGFNTQAISDIDYARDLVS